MFDVIFSQKNGSRRQTIPTAESSCEKMRQTLTQTDRRFGQPRFMVRHRIHFRYPRQWIVVCQLVATAQAYLQGISCRSEWKTEACHGRVGKNCVREMSARENWALGTRRRREEGRGYSRSLSGHSRHLHRERDGVCRILAGTAPAGVARPMILVYRAESERSGTVLPILPRPPDRAHDAREP